MPAKLDTSTDPQVGYRPPGRLESNPLEPATGRLGTRAAAHLLRRAGFGGAPDEVARFAAPDASAAVDALLHPGDEVPGLTDFPDTAALYDPKTRNRTAQLWWLDRMLRTRRPLLEKMTLFWSGHFGTSYQKVPPAAMVAQIDLYRLLALARFPVLLSAVTRDPGMLIFLDNRYNVKAHPNENYAREVMELFALGLGNYSEDDIKEAARAFTGWTIDRGGAAVFDPKRHDDGVKTIFGKSGAFGTDDVIALIVSQPIHQRFIAHKLLEFFVYSDPEPELIEAVAQTYALSGFDLAKTVGTILRSSVFFSPRAYRALPKSPLEFALGTLRYLGVASVPANLPDALARMGQVPLAPPSVKGWDGGPAWINTSTLLARFNFVNALLARNDLPLPNVAPDAIVARTGMDAARVAATIVAGAVQDDVTSDVRSTLVGYLNSVTPAAGSSNPLPFGPENYQAKIRGAVALALNLPVNQLN